MPREEHETYPAAAPAWPPAAPAVLEALRAATARDHERLDAAFGALDLGRQADLARFLRGHAIGMAALFPAFRQFVEHELGLTCPDYPAALGADLAMMGADARDLPQLAPPVIAGEIDGEGAALGLAYVVAGSRLGLAVLRKRGYAGRASGRRSRYMEDESGIVIWRVLLGHMRENDLAPDQISAACTAARDAFACFERAFVLSAQDVSIGMNGIARSFPETDAA